MIRAAANVTVTLYADEVEVDKRALFATSGKQRKNHLLPAGLNGRTFRVNCSSSSKFQIWSISGDMKTVGNVHGYQSIPIMQGETQLVSRAILQAA